MAGAPSPLISFPVLFPILPLPLFHLLRLLLFPIGRFPYLTLCHVCHFSSYHGRCFFLHRSVFLSHSLPCIYLYYSYDRLYSVVIDRFYGLTLSFLCHCYSHHGRCSSPLTSFFLILCPACYCLHFSRLLLLLLPPLLSHSSIFLSHSLSCHCHCHCFSYHSSCSFPINQFSCLTLCSVSVNAPANTAAAASPSIGFPVSLCALSLPLFQMPRLLMFPH